VPATDPTSSLAPTPPTAADDPTAPVPPAAGYRRTVLVLGFLAFVLAGGMHALYGPSFPLFRARYGIGTDDVSAVVSAHFLGAFVTIALSGVLLRRFGYRPVLLAGSAFLAAGLALVAVAPVWWVVLAGATVAGAGFGLVVVGFNLLTARAFAPRAAPALNVLNATFGLGAVLAPLLVAALAPRLAVPFLAFAGLSVVVLAATLRLPTPPAERGDGRATPLVWSQVAGFVLLYFLYVAVEVGVTSWETEHLTPAFGAAAAARFTALYWGAITVGRLLATPISARVRPRHLVVGAASAAVVFLALAHLTSAAPIAYVLVGFALAPIFPTGLAWLTATFPRRAEQITSVAVAAANLGPVATAPLIGIAVTAVGPSVIPTALTTLAAMLAVTVAWLGRKARV
jgi:MFS transporter, FHS family, glucose/mannose:H+ symporter